MSDVKDGDGGSLEKEADYVYSEFSTWPPQIDPDCHERLCADNQICVPGRIQTKESRTDCSFICLDLAFKGNSDASPPSSADPSPASGTDTSTTSGTDTSTTIGADTSTISGADTSTTSVTDISTTSVTDSSTTNVTDSSTTSVTDTFTTSQRDTFQTSQTGTSQASGIDISTASGKVTSTQSGTDTSTTRGTDASITSRTDTSTTSKTHTSTTGEAETTPTIETDTSSINGTETSTTSETDNSQTSGTVNATTSGTDTFPSSGSVTSRGAGTDTSTTRGTDASITTGRDTSPEIGTDTSTTSRTDTTLTSGSDISPTTGTSSVASSSRSVTSTLGGTDTSVTSQNGGLSDPSDSINGPTTSTTSSTGGKGFSTDSFTDTSITSTLTLSSSVIKGIGLVGGAMINTGRLELFDREENTWRSVQLDIDVWNWKSTEVACRQLGYYHGGSYHKQDKPFPAGVEGSFVLQGLVCNGSEDSIFDCHSDDIIKSSDNSDDIGITCFRDNVNWQGNYVHELNLQLMTSEGWLNPLPSNPSIAKIEYDGTWTRVCGQLNEKAADVFCKTMYGSHWSGEANQNDTEPLLMWTKNIACFHDDTPHPFYCMNEGWKLETCTQYVLLACLPDV